MLGIEDHNQDHQFQDQIKGIIRIAKIVMRKSSQLIR
jgi:hypothetical protein